MEDEDANNNKQRWQSEKEEKKRRKRHGDDEDVECDRKSDGKNDENVSFNRTAERKKLGKQRRSPERISWKKIIAIVLTTRAVVFVGEEE